MLQETTSTTTHGWQPCRACHLSGQNVRIEGDWHLYANPGYWGNAAPRVLVLGFSKGATQVAAAEAGAFDAVAFAKMRPRLQAILDALDLDLEGQDIEQALTAESRVMGAASLVRCGLAVMKDGRLMTSGTIMPRALKAGLPRKAMETCIRRHLAPLPDSVETVVLLGTIDAYMKGVKELMRQQFPDYQHINEVAFRAQGRTWVFAAHPSPANGTFDAWLAGDPSTRAGRKRQQALAALGMPPAPPRPRAPAPVRVVAQAPAIQADATRDAPARKGPGASRRVPDEERFAQTFHLVRHDGRKVVPVRMEDEDTGRVAFRVARIGNTKENTLEVTDEAELLRLCESGQYKVRVQPLDRSSSAGFIRPLLKHRVAKGRAT